jgi:hypothetical protein
MKKFCLMGLLVFTTSFLFAQTKTDDIINAKEVERIEKTLSSDDMRGRKTFTPDIDKAADFIAGEFKKIGLEPLSKSGRHRQEFVRTQSKFISSTATLDGNTVDQKNKIGVTCQPELKIDQTSGYEKAVIKQGGNLFREAATFVQSNKNVLVMVDESFASNFSRLAFFKRSIFKTDKIVIFILGNTVPKSFTIEASHEIIED